MTSDEYLRWRNEFTVPEDAADSIVELTNGRVVQICHRPMPDRGWVATHEDITERHRAEKMLSTRQNRMPSGPRLAATPAHTRLIEALDVVPEGLVILDSDDRYVLWNRRYAEAYAESRDVIAPGCEF